MIRVTRYFLSALFALLVAGSVSAEGWRDFFKGAIQQSTPAKYKSALPESEIVRGLREALARGTRSAVLELGQTDGFWANDQFRIPLPGPVTQAGALLRAAGLGPRMEELHLLFNRAAEKAVPVAADVFSQAVQNLTLTDAREILSGPPDAATRYFQNATQETLAIQFRPLVSEVTARSGIVQQYERLVASAGPLAQIAGANTDVNDYVTEQALDSLFARVAEEEKLIRTNPAARSSEILRKVFTRN